MKSEEHITMITVWRINDIFSDTTAAVSFVGQIATDDGEDDRNDANDAHRNPASKKHSVGLEL
jgi:hypothetical protein